VASVGYGAISPKLAHGLARERRRTSCADLAGDFIDAETRAGCEGQAVA
jgi:hypothetical protein